MLEPQTLRQNRIAALMLASRYPAGLSANLVYFDRAKIDLFVHVDAKIDQRLFSDFTKNRSGNITFIENRIRIFWAGFTMVEATINLLKQARGEGHYDNYLIISDDTLPVVSPAELQRKLNIAEDFFEWVPLDSSQTSNYDHFYMFDSEATQLRAIKIVDRYVTDDAMSRFHRMCLLHKHGKKPVAAHYKGKQWMSLTAKSVNRILASWEDDPWLRESFEFSFVPDETYFYAILAAHALPQSRRFMYDDWSGNPVPKVFRSIDELRSVDFNGALFVRKIEFEANEIEIWIDTLLRLSF